MTHIGSRLPDELDDIFDDLRSEFLAPVDDGVESAHLNAMADALASRPTPLAPRRARRVLVAAALGAAVIGGGIAAASGDLPGPLQDAVSRALEPFGLDVPRSHADVPSGPDLAPDEGSPPAADPSDGLEPTPMTPNASTPNESKESDKPMPSAESPIQAGSPDEAETHGNGAPSPSGSAPGQQNDPGNSENAPGQTGENPGQTGESRSRSDTAPGHSDTTNNRPESPPGHVL